MRKLVLLLILLCFAAGCYPADVRKVLLDVEPMLENHPSEALSKLDSIDASSLRLWRLKARYSLFYAIALDKNHKDNGSFVSEIEAAASWFERFGNRQNRMMSEYYYGDQLRGAGRLEEAAVQFMLSEKEAVALEDWFIAGMSARSLYYVYGNTHNRPEELSSIERALDYFHDAGKSVHEDDARIKLAIACYDNYQINKADSLFNEAIRIAVDKKDTTRLRVALVNSVCTMLLEEPYRPDSAISHLTHAESLGLRHNCRTLANFSLAESLIGNYEKSKEYLSSAYGVAQSDTEIAFVKYRENQALLAKGDSVNSLPLIYYLYSHVNDVATKTLEQSVVKAQNNYLLSSFENIKQKKSRMAIASVSTFLLLIAIMTIFLISYKRKNERIRIAEAEKQIKFDKYCIASEELTDLGFKSFDHIIQECSALGSRGERILDKAYDRLVMQFQNEEKYKQTFVDSIDKTHEGIVTKLKNQMPELGDKQIMLFACFVQGLSYSTMSVLMANKQRQYLYDRRQSLIKSIKGKSPADKELFLSFLQNRPTRVK